MDQLQQVLVAEVNAKMLFA